MSLTQNFAGGQYLVCSLKFMLVFFFMTHLSSYINLFETETFLGGNRKVILGHLYTRWTSEDVDIALDPALCKGSDPGLAPKI